MIYFLLCIAMGYLVITSVVLFINRHDFKPLLSVSPHPDDEAPPLVSICIPARNEQRSIKRAVESAIQQSYANIEILILDDQSTDRTWAILAELKADHPEKLILLKGKDKPVGWLGKSWACHQLSEKASGQILFFIDADVWLKNRAVARAVRSLAYYSIDFLTVWPMQKMTTFWEKAVIPIVYYGLLSLLPARYVYQKPRWLPSSLEDQIAPKFAAACGQCMVFKRSAYGKIGGHQSVKDKIVEDVALAKAIKKQGLAMRMFHGRHTVWCRMYRSQSEMWNGFRKNFLALFNNSVPAFLWMAFINFVAFISPLIILFIGIIQPNSGYIYLSLSAFFIMVLHRIILAKWYGWSIGMSFLHPVGILWFHSLGVRVLIDYARGRRASWKNRPTI